MALEVPTSFNYEDYVQFDSAWVRQVLLHGAGHDPRWRHDSGDRIHGGARRTYLPMPHHLSDRLLFGGSNDFKRVMNVCIGAANRLMQKIVDGPWEGNRVVINRIPPLERLSRHTDPRHFKDGVIVIGAGEAALVYEKDGEENSEPDPEQSLMYIPPGVPHRVENGDAERLSIVVAHDTQLAAGKSAVGQYIEQVYDRLVFRQPVHARSRIE